MSRPLNILLLPLVLTALLAGAVSSRAAQAPQEIRVVLSDKGSLAQVGGDLNWRAAEIALGRTTDVTDVKLSSFGVKAEVAGKVNEAPRLTAVPASGYVRFGGKHYRGRLEFFRGKDDGLVVLNVLPLEDYLLSVVPSEMPSSWPKEALKAQAVAARTYAISRMAARRESSYDVYATVSDQVYTGVAGEDERSSVAVKETAGRVVTFQGEPIIAYFSSDCGGCTCAGEQPYLQSVPIEVPDSPHNYWKLTLSSSEMDEAIRGTGGNVGTVESIVVERDANSGHLQSITFKGSKGSHSIKAAKLRRILGYNVMKSTRVAVEPVDSDATKKVLQLPAGSVISGNEGALIQKMDSLEVEKSALASKSSAQATDVVEVSLSDSTTPEVMQGWHRPWVADAAGSGEQKMRSLYAFDGEELERCNREVHLAGADGKARLMDSGEETVPAELTPPPLVRTTPIVPPLTTREFSKVQYSRSGGLSGIILHGSGYGHGMGLSQWGARQLASDGYSYDQILAYFYQGTDLENWGGSLPAAVAAEDDEYAVEVEEFYQPFTEVGSAY